MTDIEYIEGYVDVVTDTYVAGWAVATQLPAEVRVTVGGRHLGLVRCDVERPELPLFGLPAKAGFLFPFPVPIGPDEDVAVQFPDGKHLQNSPNNPRKTLRDERSTASDVPDETQQITLILGTPGSGIALCSALTSLLGIQITDSAADAAAQHASEHRDPFGVSESIFAAAGRGRSHEPHGLALPTGWLRLPENHIIKSQMMAWLGAKLRRATSFGLADPTTCHVIPLWDQLCVEFGLRPRFVYYVTQPTVGVHSLMVQQSLTEREAERLWMATNSRAIHDLGDRLVCIISQDDWLDAPLATLTRLAEHVAPKQLSSIAILAQIAAAKIAAASASEPVAFASVGSAARGLFEEIVASATKGRFTKAAQLVAATICETHFFNPAGQLSGLVHDGVSGTSKDANACAHENNHAVEELPVSSGTIARARDGDLFAQMEIKTALTKQYTLEEAFSIFRRVLDLPESSAIVLTTLDSQYAVLGRHGSVLMEFEPRGASFNIEPPSVIGAGNHRTIEGEARSIYLGCFTDARVRGRSALIGVEDVLALDYEGDELQRLDDRLEFDPTIFSAETERVWAIVAERRRPELEIDEAFTLLGPHTDAFGHWIWEYLPKYIVASMSGALPPVPLLVDQRMPVSQRQALELMLPQPVPLISVGWGVSAHVRNLWVAASQMHMPLLEQMNDRFKWDYLASPPTRFAVIIREMVRRLEPSLPSDPGHNRVYLARRPSRHRKLDNYLIVEAVAQARGFHIVYPEDLDFRDQVALVRGARFIVGPEGSAFFLTFFARPGTKVCLLDHPNTAALPLLAGPLNEIGVETTVFTGPYVSYHPEWPHQSDYTIDETALADFLSVWLAR
jgi:hypothetical protein